MGPLIRNLSSRLNFWVLAGLLLVFLCFLYLVVGRFDRRVDLTKDRIFTLSQKSREVLRGIKKDKVTVKAFFKSDQAGREELEDFLKVYAHECPRLSYFFIDPDRNPGQSKLYQVDEYGTIIVEKGAKRERVREISEEALTNAILKLYQVHETVIAFTKGHGEKILSDVHEPGLSSFRTRLEAESYKIQEIFLYRDAIPANTDVLAVVGPTADFLPEEIDAIKNYAEKGGKVLLLLDPVQARLTQFENWLRTYGVVLGQNVVIDKLSRIFGADYLIPVVTQYGNHKITEKFSVASFLPFSRSVSAAREIPAGIQVSELAMTSQGSWAEQDWKQIESGEVSFDEGDIAGPVSLAAVVEKENSSMRLVVFGDSDFIDNAHLYLSGNKDLILNTAAWLAGDEKLVSIRPRSRESAPLILSSKQQKFIFIVPVAVMPIASLMVGFVVFIYRKQYT